MRTSILGVVFAIMIIWRAVSSSALGSNIFLDQISLMIVIGGTISSGIITYGLVDMFKIFSMVSKVFLKPSYDLNKALNQAINVSSAIDENPSAINRFLKDETHPFLKDGLRLVQNEVAAEEIENIMVSDLENRSSLHMHYVDMFRTLSKYPPAFGMIGTVIGLVALLGSLAGGDSSLIGRAMATALLTTLYGLIVANFILIPLGDNLLHRLKGEISLRKMIIETVLLIKKKEDPILIKEYLQVYVQPHERVKIKLFESRA